MSPRPERTRWSYEYARTKQDAVDAAARAVSWLEDLTGVDLGHVGDHAVTEALKNIQAVVAFLRRPDKEAH